MQKRLSRVLFAAFGLPAALWLCAGCGSREPAEPAMAEPEAPAEAPIPERASPAPADAAPVPVPPPQAVPPPVVSADTGVPETFQNLAIQPVAEPPGYRITDLQDADVDFVAPQDYVRSVFRQTRMRDEEKRMALLSYPKMEQSMRDRREQLSQPGPPVEREAVVLDTPAYGRVELRVDPQDARMALFSVDGTPYAMSASLAYRVADDARLDDADKLETLLRFPFLKNVNTGEVGPALGSPPALPQAPGSPEP